MNIYSLSFSQLVDFVTKIQYGYIDADNNKHLDVFSNPNKKYFLQSPSQLVQSNIGLCFDIVELYRDYFIKRGIECESYYLEYKDKNILETHAFIIQKRKNNLWYECLDNSWESDFRPRGYHDKEAIIKSIYEWFQEYVSSYHKNILKENFYMAQYQTPISVFKRKVSLMEFCNNRPSSLFFQVINMF